MSDNNGEQKSQSVSRDRGNSKNPVSRARSWICTINNYTNDDLAQLSRLSTTSKFYIIGKEVGEEKKTPHIQAYFQFKNQTRFSTLRRKVPRAHWEKARGTVQENYDYCSKEGDFTTNIVPKVTREQLKQLVLESYNDVTWRPWQRAVLDYVQTNPDSRTIRWIYEPTGNVGKSFLAKYLCCQPGTIISSGKATDIFNQVNSALESGQVPKTIICDIPRVVSKFVSYQALEKLKDGCLYSGKYEGGVCIFPNVHVICFANQRPETSNMSADRWIVERIQDNQLFLQVSISH